MSQVAEFLATLDRTQPMTPEQMREFTRRAWADKQAQHETSDRTAMTEWLRGE